MPSKFATRVPSYRLHKASGQAVVTINGRDLYLGKWNTAAGKAEYDRVIAEYLANGRQLKSEDEKTFEYVTDAYLVFAQQYYRKNETVTREFDCISEAFHAANGWLFGSIGSNGNFESYDGIYSSFTDFLEKWFVADEDTKQCNARGVAACVLSNGTITPAAR